MKLLLLLLLSASTVFATDTLTLAFGAKENTPAFAVSKSIIDEMNRRLDSTLHLELQFMPYGRAAIKLCAEESDGDFARTELVYKGCSNVIKIPVSMLKDEYYMFGKEEAHKRFPHHPDSTARYIAILGNKIVLHWKEENNIPCHEVLDYRQALKMIDLDRVDFYIGSPVYAKDSLFQSLKIVQGAEPILTTDYFLYINPKHEEHAGQLTTVLYNMKEEGVLKQLIHGGAK